MEPSPWQNILISILFQYLNLLPYLNSNDASPQVTACTLVDDMSTTRGLRCNGSNHYTLQRHVYWYAKIVRQKGDATLSDVARHARSAGSQTPRKLSADTSGSGRGH